MIRILLSISSFFIFQSYVIAQQGQVRFEAFCNAKQVVPGSFFEVKFTLKNANGTNFRAPDFKNFRVVAGPSTSMSTSIINGKVSKEMGYSYTLQPLKTGKFAIGSASIKVNGKMLKTTPLTIEVVKGKNTNVGKGQTGKGQAGGEAFVKLEPSSLSAKIGQQILLNYKLYTTVNIDSYNIVEEPAYTGFYAQAVKRFNSATLKEVVDGVQYTTKVLKRVALFPQQAGQLTIQSAQIQLGMLVDNPNARSFFFSRRVQPILVKTNPVEILVDALPPNAPETFTGAVGKYTLRAVMTPNRLTTDDVLTVKMIISGNGDVKRVQPPPLMLSDSFEVYDPKITEERTFENQGEMGGGKAVEYLAIPKVPGNYLVQPEFTYFDTDSLKYVTLKAGPFRARVKKGSNKNMGGGIAETTSPIEDIRFIKLTANLQKEGAPFFGSTTFWVFTLLPFLLLCGVIAAKQIQTKRAGMDISLLKKRRAKKVAQKRLAMAKMHLQHGDSSAFYDEISRASLGYVCDKLDIPVAELTKENVRDKLQSLRVSSSNIEQFMKILESCEMALFAGMDNSDAVKETYEKSVAVIAGIEEEIGVG